MSNRKIGGVWEDIADGNNQTQRNIRSTYCPKCGRKNSLFAALTRCDCNTKKSADSIFVEPDIIERCPSCYPENKEWTAHVFCAGCRFEMEMKWKLASAFHHLSFQKSSSGTRITPISKLAYRARVEKPLKMLLRGLRGRNERMTEITISALRAESFYKSRNILSLHRRAATSIPKACTLNFSPCKIVVRLPGFQLTLLTPLPVKDNDPFLLVSPFYMLTPWP